LAFPAPFGLRHMFYADYTASGRALGFIEDRMREIERSYANTHTEDDYSGRTMTRLYHAALDRIRELVHAGPGGKVFPIGSGSTGALKKLQEILGVYIPPLTRERILAVCHSHPQARKVFESWMDTKRPVVFIGPYEHHTNELMWREALTEVVVVRLGADGNLNLEDLESKLTDPRFRGRPRFGSFSAGSNITGIRTKVYEVARLCRACDAAVFFDFAAVAPYVEIDMNTSSDAAFDAVFFSPHKFLGGPGSCGLLVMTERLYRSDLPPTVAGGGTVVYVGPKAHDFATDIETRETAGTPPILQTIKAALAMDVKARIGTDVIEKIETRHLDFFLEALGGITGVRLVGRTDTGDLTPIVSFNIVHQDRILHPKFVTTLLNDLFGIQSRAGCSCAGPYGHVLLGIDEPTSERFREAVTCGLEGLKPGWVRINLHYVFTRDDIRFLIGAIRFIARWGDLFLRLYDFDIRTGGWRHRTYREPEPSGLTTARTLRPAVNLDRLEERRAGYFRKAQALARKLAVQAPEGFHEDPAAVEALKSFAYVHGRK
jgi:selenocysteine lyase/cysteine desulfurase